MRIDSAHDDEDAEPLMLARPSTRPQRVQSANAKLADTPIRSLSQPRLNETFVQLTAEPPLRDWLLQNLLMMLPKRGDNEASVHESTDSFALDYDIDRI